MSLLCVFATVCAVYMWQKMRKRHYCMSVCIVIQLGSAAPKWHKITYCRVDIQCSSTLKSRELNTHQSYSYENGFLQWSHHKLLFSPLKMPVYFYFFYFRGLKMEIKSYILTVNFIFFKLVFLLCFRLSALTSLCVTSQGSDMSWRTIAKTLTVDTTRKCFKFFFVSAAPKRCILYLTFCFCFDGGCFRSNSCDLKGKPVKETNAFTLNRDFQRILFNLVSSHLVSVVSTYFYVRWSSFSCKTFFFF